jgi:simple sugar transport system ATP-binding protein
MDIHPGRLHCLLGENGAGKSTLMSILAGRFRADAGRIILRGQPTRFDSPAQALAQGVGMVYQRFMLIPSFTVAENLALAGVLDHEAAQRGRLARLFQQRRVMFESAEALIRRFGMRLDPKKPVSACAMAERQNIELLKLLGRDAQTLILDEPTATLSAPEIEGLFATLDRLRDQGRALVLITHKLREVEALADEITIMRKGRVVLRNQPFSQIERSEVARLMLGPRELPVLTKNEPTPLPVAEPLLTLERVSGEDASGRSAFKDVSLTLAAGEILAVVGVTGNGQSELAAAAAGFSFFSSGKIMLQGRTWLPGAPPRQNLDLAYIPSDRDTTATVPGLSLSENLRLGQSRTHAKPDRRNRRANAVRIIERFGVRASGPETPASALSGGNLQKFILGRELSKQSALLVAENPTQGLDLLATQEIRALIREAAKGAGRTGVLLVTSDLDEALELADRIAVMANGRVLEIFDLRDTRAASGPNADVRLLDRIGMRMAGFIEETRV